MSKKRVSVDSYRYPAVVSPGSLRRNSAVDVGYSDRSKRLATGGEPVEELVDTAKFAADRFLGTSALCAHPFLESAGLDAIGVTFLLKLIEPTQKS